MTLFEQLPIRHQARLYCMVRRLVLSWEAHICERLREAGFIFNDKQTPEVIQSIIMKEYDE